MKRSVSILMSAAVLVLASQSFAQTPGAPAQPAGEPPAKAVAKAKPKVYDESADAKVQIADALASAKKNNRRVLIQWGGNWCSWCIKLHDLCAKDTKIKELLYEYDVVHIDAGQKDKNMDLAKSYAADAKTHGFPYLTILDADGKVIANQETASLENKDQEKNPGHDPKAVLDLLTKYHAAPVDAAKILDAGLAEAKKDDKVVLLHFGAPWCVYCHKMENWMARPEIAQILAKQFVDVKIDTDRDTGGNEIFEKYAGSDKVGIPWFVFLNKDGKSTADAFMDGKTNVGFPMAPAEVEHFQKMLKAGAPKLSDADVKTLIDSLTVKEKAAPEGH